MLTCREDGPTLSIIYRPRALAIVAFALLLVGVVLGVIGLRRPHEATLHCEGARCTLERVGVLASERVEVTGLRGADAAQELVLRADGDIVMGPWVGRRQVSSYRAAEKSIEAYVQGGSTGVLDVTVPVRGTLRWLGFAALALVLGIAIGVVFAIGARAVLDRDRDEVRRFGSKQRAKLTDITAIDVRKNQILATVRGGRPIAIVSALGTSAELDTVATQIRRFVLS